ncbi:MAG TPA: GNAT family N-acetyltransferase [Niallia sp.]|nr:GNAT family N-acetyltransferase [Niallia sp.]
MNINIEKVIVPTNTLIKHLNKWENNPNLVPMIRPSKSKEEQALKHCITKEELTSRLKNLHMYTISVGNTLVGEMNYMIDPAHLYKKEKGTAWIGITIGEKEARGKGVGAVALTFLEKEIKNAGITRIELGVFSFNTNAKKLYEKLGYKEIGVNKEFTYYQEKMWDDIRMEKYL